MSQIADWIIPSHYRELKLSRGQRAAAHRLAEARKQSRDVVRELPDPATSAVPAGAPDEAPAGLTQDFRIRPIAARPTLSEPKD